MMRNKNFDLLFFLIAVVSTCTAYNVVDPSKKKIEISRRNVFNQVVTSAAVAAATTTFVVATNPLSSYAFDGTGSSSYAGRNAATKAELIEGYKARIIEDVKDFNALGEAIERGETDGKEWIAVFIQFQRREPDPVGRTYAACIDLIGIDRSTGGGAARLLAATFAKPNKPPDNLPQIKKYNALVKTLDPIQDSGKKGDIKKAKKTYSAASIALSEYLQEVGMSEDLSTYK